MPPFRWTPDLIRTEIAAGAPAGRLDQEDGAGDHAIDVALRSGDPGLVAALIAAGADPDARGKNGTTALLRAFLWPLKPTAVAALLAGGADPDAEAGRGMRALHFCAIKEEPGSAEVAALLAAAGADLDKPNEEGDRPLDRAMESSNTEVAVALVDAGADCSTASRHTRGIPWLMKTETLGTTILLEAFVAARPDEIDADLAGLRPLHRAAHLGFPEAVGRLLEAGADPTAPDDKGRTPLHFVLRDAPTPKRLEDSLAIARKLLAAGADPDAPDQKGVTPRALLLAAVSAHEALDILALRPA